MRLKKFQLNLKWPLSTSKENLMHSKTFNKTMYIHKQIFTFAFVEKK